MQRADDRGATAGFDVLEQQLVPRGVTSAFVGFVMLLSELLTARARRRRHGNTDPHSHTDHCAGRGDDGENCARDVACCREESTRATC